VWHVRREDGHVVAEDSRGRSYRFEIAGARSVRVVPLTGGNPHGGAGQGFQVAVRRDEGDVLIGAASLDWRAARELARQLCETAELPLDELTQRLFSRVGQYGPPADEH
jgi:hypothetical protein